MGSEVQRGEYRRGCKVQARLGAPVGGHGTRPQRHAGMALGSN